VYLFVGLGNPGKKYEHTRHNLGFMVLDRLGDKWGCKFKKGFGPYHSIQARRKTQRVILAKPTTYMNQSGIAVDDLMKRYKPDLSKIVVVCDDFNLPLGAIRLRSRGSDGGHQGLASIIRFLGTEEFSRLRLGVGLEPGADVVQYVLSRFSRQEKSDVNRMVEQAAEAVDEMLDHPIEWIMNRFNQ
jgi:PTH1 family peptidyl-tRNA hydrolase